jgi:hypothetical protein
VIGESLGVDRTLLSGNCLPTCCALLAVATPTTASKDNRLRILISDGENEVDKDISREENLAVVT